LRIAIARPMVATTMGIMPNLKQRVDHAALEQPSPARPPPAARSARRLSSSGAPSGMNASIAKAGSITNSPWAKLIVPEACHSSVKPSAASA
jgi:hypothetical protein